MRGTGDGDEAVRACLAAYDAWAASYDSIDNPLIAQAASGLEEHAASLGGARVLELVGCGTGRNAALCLAADAVGYVGIDGSPGMLAVARQRMKDARVRFVDGDLVEGARQLVAAGASGGCARTTTRRSARSPAAPSWRATSDAKC